MLLALAMELALKAWFVFDFDDPKHSKSHDLSKLFGRLKSESLVALCGRSAMTATSQRCH